VESNFEYTYHIARLTKTGESLPCIILRTMLLSDPCFLKACQNKLFTSVIEPFILVID
jgi:hypothetical protein